MRFSVVPILFVLATPLAAQQQSADTLLSVNRFLDYETVAEPVVSPDGAHAIFTRRSVDKMTDVFETALWIMNEMPIVSWACISTLEASSGRMKRTNIAQPSAPCRPPRTSRAISRGFSQGESCPRHQNHASGKATNYCKS